MKEKLFAVFTIVNYSKGEDVASLDGILKKGGANKQFAMPLNDGWYLSAFFFALPELGYSVTYDDNLNQTSVSINFDEPSGEKIAQTLYRYICNPAVMSAADDSKIISGFENGTVIAAVSGSWNATDLQRILGDNLGTAKLPTVTVEGEQVQNLLSMTPHVYRISKEGAARLAATEKLTDTASAVLNVYRKKE